MAAKPIQSLQKVNFDIAFIGVTRFDQETGFTCESLEDALLKRTVHRTHEKDHRADGLFQRSISEERIRSVSFRMRTL